MADRLLRVVVPVQDADTVNALLAERAAAHLLRDEMSEGLARFEVLVAAEAVEGVLDPLQERFGSREGFHVAVLPVETALPRRDAEADAAASADGSGGAASGRASSRISREELYDDLSDLCRPTPTYVVLVIVSTVAATIGIARDDTAVLIGAMVIAPLLGPNMALALASTLGDRRLAGRALVSNGVGVGVAFVVAVAASLLLDLDPDAELARTRALLGLSDLTLALAAGIAGALAFTGGVPASLVGVMVAVALLPPLAVCALYLTVGRWDAAIGAALLLAANVVCVNLAGIATFLAQGVSPRRWWKKRSARAVAWRMMTLWAVLLAALALIVLLARPVL